MSDDTTPGLRERIAEALTSEHYRRARERIVASPEEHSAGMAEAAMAVVQPELDRLTERIPYREGETEEQYLERQIARWRSEAWQARGKLQEAEAERDQALVDLETAKGWRDETRAERDEYRRANTQLQELATLRASERDQLKAAIDQVRRLCDLTIGASIRRDAIDQAIDTLAVLDRSDLPAVREFAAKLDPRGEAT